jgi:hypothetical protein
MTRNVSPYPTSMTISRQLIALLRAEKARVALQTQRFWSYEDLLRALLLHWQTLPPTTLPSPDDLMFSVQEQPA